MALSSGVRSLVSAGMGIFLFCGSLLAQEETPVPSPSPTETPGQSWPGASAAQEQELSVLKDIRYCLLYIAGVGLAIISFMPWGNWHKK